MKKKVFLCGGALAAAMLTGCASIISGGKTEVAISSNAPEANIHIRHSVTGEVLHQGKNPMIVKLNTSKGLFEPAVYRLEVTDKNKNKQTRIIQSGFNAWFIGNFIFGGILGMGIDAISGAVYKFDSEYYVHFDQYENAE